MTDNPKTSLPPDAALLGGAAPTESAPAPPTDPYEMRMKNADVGVDPDQPDAERAAPLAPFVFPTTGQAPPAAPPKPHTITLLDRDRHVIRTHGLDEPPGFRELVDGTAYEQVGVDGNGVKQYAPS